VNRDERTADAGSASSQPRRHPGRRALFSPLPGLLALVALGGGVALAASSLRALPGEDGGSGGHSTRLNIAPRKSSKSVLSSPYGPIIGTNDGAGWGPQAAHRILRGHITWNRVEVGARSNSLEESRAYGFKVLAIVNNVADQEPLSAIEPAEWGSEAASEIKASPGISIAEAGNESYLKAGVANPVAYGRMYLAAVQDMRAAHIHIPLLFNMTGDYPLHTWSEPGGWSEDAKGGGWLRTAVTAVPGLAAAILANGLAIHPYGAPGENTHDDWGINAVAAQEAVANTVLGSIPPVYVTEIGYALNHCGSSTGACGVAQQASKLRAAYGELLADPHVQGIWWYQSHDDSTGEFGYMTRRNVPRPAFRALSAIGAEVGQ
jgi:hypothetical protein